MKAAEIHKKIYAGRGAAALRLGLDYDVFRPTVASNPLLNKVATIKAAFNSEDNAYKKPNKPGDAYWHGDFDGRMTRPGDYLVNSVSEQVYYIAAQQQLLPILCVDCNRAVRISRAAPQGAVGAVGAVGYSGLCDSPAESMDVLGVNPASNDGKFVGWPCSILFGGRSQVAARLPADVKNTGWRILLPPSAPVVVRAGDILTDDLGRRYSVEGAELSASGWRINSQEAHT